MPNSPNSGLYLEGLGVHAADTSKMIGAPLTPEINLSTSFRVDASTPFTTTQSKGDLPLFYARWANPTVTALEHALALLDGGEAAVCFATGMAAISGLAFAMLRSGDHVVIQDVCYAGTAELFRDIIPELGIEVSWVDTSDPANVVDAIRSRTKLILIETPANPILRLADISAIAAISKAAGVKLAVDSTIATPVATRPLSLGADFVVHSLTKYLGGHGDAMGGVVIGSSHDLACLRRRSLVHLGAVLHPFAAWCIERGLQTLSPRMDRHARNAMIVARYLQAHPRVTRVFYPGLPSHPQHELAKRQMHTFSGLISFQARDPTSLQERLSRDLRVISHAISLGKTKSLIFYLNSDEMLNVYNLGASHDAYRRWAGDGIFRLSVGLEAAADIIADLARVLDKKVMR